MNSEQDNPGASMKEYPQSESATGRRGRAKFKSPLAIFAALLFVVVLAGCFRGFIKYDPPDELAGWQYLGGRLWEGLGFAEVPTAVLEDLKEYAVNASKAEGWDPRLAGFNFFKKPTGEIAVKILYGKDYISWEHVLFYDSHGVRTNSIKRKRGTYDM